MSIVLKDGTVLPDIPNDYAEEYPYQIVAKSSGEMAVESYGVTPYFQAFIAKSRMAAVPLELSDKGAPGIGCTDVEGYRRFYYSPGGSWEENYSGSAFRLWLYNADVLLVELVWSNHDILTATAMDDDAYIYVPGTEIYFPNSEAPKPPFILPDGTELPALPEGCFEKYPYGVILHLHITYNGQVADEYTLHCFPVPLYMFTSHIVSDADGASYDTLMALNNPISYVRYELSEDMSAWSESYEHTDVTFEGIVDDFMLNGIAETVGSVAWSNHDILTATENDDGTSTPGPDLYRKSDVNYRIYGGWLNSMANQARRLGGVTGSVKPGEMEASLKEASLSALAKDIVERTITSLNNEDFTSIGSSGMRHCAKLTDVVLPNVTTLGQYAFYQCTALKRVELPKTTSIGNYGFGNCSVLATLILANTAKVCTLSNVNAFTGTLIASGTGYIYVPSALLDSYKAATNWSTYAAQFRAIEDYPDI